MEVKFFLVLDFGSTNLKCSIFRLEQHHSIEDARSGKYRTTASSVKFEELQTSRVRFPVIESSDGSCETNPDVLFISVLNLIRQTLEASSLTIEEITAIGISSQRNTLITWNAETGESYHNFISWKDRRSSEIAQRWNRSPLCRLVRFIGWLILMIFPWGQAKTMKAVFFRNGYVFPRLDWLKKNIRGFNDRLHHGDSHLGLLSSWILWKLTKRLSFCEEYSTLSSTDLFNPAYLRWNSILLWFFGVPRRILPEIRNTISLFGELAPEYFGKSVPIWAMTADQQAAAFGQGLFHPGDSKITLGTGAFLNVNIGDQLLFDNEKFLYTLVGWKLSDTAKAVRLLETQVEEYPKVLKWAYEIGLTPHTCQQIPPIFENAMWLDPKELVSRRPGNLDPLVLSDMSNEVRVELTFAVVETIGNAIAKRFEILHDAAENMGIHIRMPIKMDGGLSRSDALMRVLSSLRDQTVVRPKIQEMTSYGTALLTALGAGFLDLEAVEGLVESVEFDVFEPDSSLRAILTKRRSAFELLQDTSAK